MRRKDLEEGSLFMCVCVGVCVCQTQESQHGLRGLVGVSQRDALVSLPVAVVRQADRRGRPALATYSEDMMEDMGPTSLAFCRACFWLNAASSSSSSFQK